MERSSLPFSHPPKMSFLVEEKNKKTKQLYRPIIFSCPPYSKFPGKNTALCFADPCALLIQSILLGLCVPDWTTPLLPFPMRGFSWPLALFFLFRSS